MGKVLKPHTEEVLSKRYYLRNPQGKLVETEFEQSCRRIADYVSLAHLQKRGDFHHLNSVSQVEPPVLIDTTDAEEWLEDGVQARAWGERFFQMHYDQVFAANSPTWFNAGNPFVKKKMLSACFLLHVPNDIKGIFKAVQDGAIIGKYGGGIGMDFSQLSPLHTLTNSGGYASGAVSFMTPFQSTAETIVQGGRRRIAEMGMLAVWHPEILMFIDCKKKTGPERIQWLMDLYNVDYEAARDIAIGFNWLKIDGRGTDSEKEDWITPYCFLNISVKISREFMDAVHNDGLFMLRRVIVEDPENGARAKKVSYEPWTGPVFDPRGDGADGHLGKNIDGLVVYKDGIAYVKAKQLWYDRLMNSAWASGEPGIMFDDVVNDDNPVKSLGMIHNSNPCGEYFQVDYNSCNLGSINLSKFFIDAEDNEYTEYVPKRDWASRVDWQKLAEIARTGTRFLDYVISMNEYPIPEITETTNASRPVGLGVMGVADLLIDLQVPYGSQLAIEVSSALMQWVQYNAWVESCLLARDFGSFPEFQNNKSYFNKKMDVLSEAIKEHPAFHGEFDLWQLYITYGVRNCHVTVIAPTGTICLIAECSSGIEPIFAFKMTRKDTIGVRVYFEPRAQAWKKIHGEDAELPAWFKDAAQTTPEEHVLMQAAFQKWCDNAISKTCNLPEDCTVEEVARVYDLALRSGLKGCTVYREGSRHGVLIRDGQKKPTKQDGVRLPEAKPVIQAGQLVVEPRPEWLEGGTRVVPDGHEGKLYVTMNHHPKDGRIFEILLRENAGNEWIELSGRLLSLLLRSNVPTKEIRQQLRRVAGQSTLFYAQKIFSSPVQLLDHVIFDQAAPYFAAKAQGQGSEEDPTHLAPDKELEPLARGPRCPQCGETLRAASGCFECPNPGCGYSKCK
jgi:ribonucleoside-diphosphate reductase alpha chain